MGEAGAWWVEGTRGGLLESRHHGHVAGGGARGELRAWAGDPDLVTFMRSAAKPLQALPLVEDGAAERFGMSPRELALCCGSHSGSPAHTALVEQLLARAGVDAGALACGPLA